MAGGRLALRTDFQRGRFPTKRQQHEKQLIQVLGHLFSKTAVLKDGRCYSSGHFAAPGDIFRC